jgi:hypothetical protein
MVVVAVVADPHVGGHRVRAGPSATCEPAGRQPRGTDESATAEVASGDRERIHRNPRIVREPEIKLMDSRFFSQASGNASCSLSRDPRVAAAHRSAALDDDKQRRSPAIV